ncbi:MAG TPA: acyl-CoA dehydrogenase family protein [Streptosporangiaceae bacterium]|nr:acyl-CoA dehydrogenase family protein [Streptosporangiaceae bacterium]
MPRPRPSGRAQAAAIHRLVEDAVGAELVLTDGSAIGYVPAETARTSTSFTIFEGTSEIQRMIIGRAVTGLDVR